MKHSEKQPLSSDELMLKHFKMLQERLKRDPSFVEIYIRALGEGGESLSHNNLNSSEITDKVTTLFKEVQQETKEGDLHKQKPTNTA